MAAPHHATSFAALRGRRVLLTGHTGFKGGWLALWLRRLGAEVIGVALAPHEGPSFHRAVGLDRLIDDRVGDIRDPRGFADIIRDVDAEIVIHMAAQALVRASYANPADTYLTNVVGTAAVLDAARAMPSLRAIIVVTSDKCYDNREWVWGYRETDSMGGADPYSASKGCQELVAASYRHSFFADPAGPQLATVRAGNVFGGGDWSADRLIPDIVRATLDDVPTIIRNPASVRPWQHVFEALAGYLTLGAALLDDGPRVAEGWNFGPDPDAVVDVETLAGAIQRAWGDGGPRFHFGTVAPGPHEAGVLRLDSTKARSRLGWRPALDLDAAVRLTIDWYKAHAAGDTDMRAFSERQLDHYVARARLGDGAATQGDIRRCA